MKRDFRSHSRTVDLADPHRTAIIAGLEAGAENRERHIILARNADRPKALARLIENDLDAIELQTKIAGIDITWA